MAARRKEAGSLTNSKRFKEEKAARDKNSIGSRAAAIAKAAGTALTRSRTEGSEVVPSKTQQATTLSNVAQRMSGSGTIENSGTRQISTGGGVSSIQSNTDVYGGITLPEYDFNSMMPGDLLNPQIQLQASEEQLNVGLEQYAAGTRAQKLLQAGFKYLEEVGKSKQGYHKAQASFVKAATESVKVEQSIVGFDTQKVELAIATEKFTLAGERLKQEQIRTVAAQSETAQLVLKVEATEAKRDAEIQRIKAQTNNIIQAYLTEGV